MKNSHNIQDDLRHLLLTRLLPVYCNDQKRSYSIEGFKNNSIKVSDYDAYNFIRTIESNIILDNGGGRYFLPLSNGEDVLFTEGHKKNEPKQTWTPII